MQCMHCVLRFEDEKIEGTPRSNSSRFLTEHCFS